MPCSLKNFSDRMGLTDMEIMLRSVRAVELMVNFKCFLSVKNLLFIMCPLYFTFTVALCYSLAVAGNRRATRLFCCPSPH